MCSSPVASASTAASPSAGYIELESLIPGEPSRALRCRGGPVWTGSLEDLNGAAADRRGTAASQEASDLVPEVRRPRRDDAFERDVRHGAG